jgi:hypothetical protein
MHGAFLPAFDVDRSLRGIDDRDHLALFYPVTRLHLPFE